MRPRPTFLRKGAHRSVAWCIERPRPVGIGIWRSWNPRHDGVGLAASYIDGVFVHCARRLIWTGPEVANLQAG